jgi:hypothetical protein
MTNSDSGFFVLCIGSAGGVAFWEAKDLDLVGGRENPLPVEDTDRVERALGGEERGRPSPADRLAIDTTR